VEIGFLAAGRKKLEAFPAFARAWRRM